MGCRDDSLRSIARRSAACVCHAVLVVALLLLLVDVDQFLVQQPIEQFEILQTFLVIGVFPETIHPSADLAQRLLDYVCRGKSSACGA